jgi:hypothetical protein
MPRGRPPKPWSETSPTQMRRIGRQLSIYLSRGEYESLLAAAKAADLSLSQYVSSCVRQASPGVQRALVLRLSSVEEENRRLHAEVERLRRAAQPEVRIGQRGTTGDLYFSVPEFLIARAVEWGRGEIDSLDRELHRTRDPGRRASIPKEIGHHQAALDIFEAMAAAYTARRKTRAG